MADVERMTLAERLKYLLPIQLRYWASSRPERNAPLTEAETAHPPVPQLPDPPPARQPDPSAALPAARAYLRQGGRGGCPAGR